MINGYNLLKKYTNNLISYLVHFFNYNIVPFVKLSKTKTIFIL